MVLQDPLDAQFSQALDRVVVIHAVVASTLQTMPSSVATCVLLNMFAFKVWFLS